MTQEPKVTAENAERARQIVYDAVSEGNAIEMLAEALAKTRQEAYAAGFQKGKEDYKNEWSCVRHNARGIAEIVADGYCWKCYQEGFNEAKERAAHISFSLPIPAEKEKKCCGQIDETYLRNEISEAIKEIQP